MFKLALFIGLVALFAVSIILKGLFVIPLIVVLAVILLAFILL